MVVVPGLALYRGDEPLTEVFLKKLEKANDPEHATLVEQARGILAGR